MGDQPSGIAAFQGADVGDQPVGADHGLDLAADLPGHGDRRVLVRLQGLDRGGVEADLRSRTGDFDNACRSAPSVRTPVAWPAGGRSVRLVADLKLS